MIFIVISRRGEPCAISSNLLLLPTTLLVVVGNRGPRIGLKIIMDTKERGKMLIFY